ncbi:hypothetical protein [Streptomyces iakyrus]|uniref:hypothetical protein n=1 Tax=Streptomyces iakyrus TaxID=68219 RepID=UPI0033CABBDC
MLHPHPKVLRLNPVTQQRLPVLGHGLVLGVVDDDVLGLAEQMAHGLVDDQEGVTVLSPVVSVFGEQHGGLVGVVRGEHRVRGQAAPIRRGYPGRRRRPWHARWPP